MNTLQPFFAESDHRNIHSLARAMQQHIDAEWEIAFQETHSKMVALYPKIGDSVYAIYGKRLFQAIHHQLGLVGLQATPRLPGSLPTSREWGAEEDRQRWMWSKITTTDGTAIGTIVTIFFHDHLQIRIPRAFQVMALDATSKKAVIAALSTISDDFKEAIDMKEEIAQYLAANPDFRV